MSRLAESKNQKLRAAFLRLLAATQSRAEERRPSVRDLAPASPARDDRQSGADATDPESERRPKVVLPLKEAVAEPTGEFFERGLTQWIERSRTA